MPGDRVVTVEADDLTQLVRDLRQLDEGKELIKQLRKDLRQAMRPAVPAIRAAVRRIPSKGQSAKLGRPGLRKTTARAATQQVKLSARMAGITVRVNPKKMPPGMHNLPAYLNGEAPFQRWRVRNFGRDDFHDQQSHPYFDDVIRRYRPAGVAAIEGSMDTMRRRLEQ